MSSVSLITVFSCSNQGPDGTSPSVVPAQGREDGDRLARLLVYCPLLCVFPAHLLSAPGMADQLGSLVNGTCRVSCQALYQALYQLR